MMLCLDLTAAYDVPSLASLCGTLTWHRAEKRLTVDDRYCFTDGAAHEIENAVIVREEPEITANSAIIQAGGETAVLHFAGRCCVTSEKLSYRHHNADRFPSGLAAAWRIAVCGTPELAGSITIEIISQDREVD